MLKKILLMLTIVVMAYAVTTVYSVEPSGNKHIFALQSSQEFIAIADSLGPSVSFFCGRKIIPGKYQFQLTDSTGSPQSDWIYSDSAGLYEYCYVPASFNPKVKIIKGAKYRLVVKHSDLSCTTDFYLDTSNVYIYGKLLGQADTMRDLAARIEGVHSVVPVAFWGVNTFEYSEAAARRAAHYVKGLGIKIVRDDLAWNALQDDSTDTDFSNLDWRVKAYTDSGVRMQAKLNYSAEWFYIVTDTITQEVDTVWYCTTGPSPDTVHRGDSLRGRGTRDAVGCYPPMRLSFPTLDSTGNINQRNWWAYYVYRIVDRFGHNSSVIDTSLCIEHWEVWNEPELRDFWGHPDTVYIPKGDTIGDRHPDPPLGGQPQASRDSMTMLYISLSRIAHAAALKADSAANLIGLVLSKPLCNRSNTSWEIKGLELAKKYYEKGGDALNDGVSFHPYQNPWKPSRVQYFNPYELEEEIDSMRAVMKDASKLLWLTEYGWGTLVDSPQCVTPAQQAQAITQMVGASVGSGCRPQGRCDHVSYFMLRDLRQTGGRPWDYYGLVDSSWNEKPGFYSMKQTVDRLKGSILNRRVFLSDVGKNDSVRIYEFEAPGSHKKTWVCWKNSGMDSTKKVTISLPTKTNGSDTIRTAYNNNPPSGTISANTYGFTTLHLDERPYYVVETSETLRPDMIVDSVWTSPNPPQVNNPVTFFARIKNVGNAAKESFEPPVNDSVCFYVDGEKKSDTLIGASVGVGDTVTVQGRFTWTPAATGSYLVKTVVNGSRVFMELSFDNNGKYRMYNISYLPPTGSIVINRDSSSTNLPAVSLYLQSYDPNRSGNQPADSMNIWEVIPPDTMVQLTFGYVPFDSFKYYRLARLTRGKKKLCVKYRITEGGLESSTYADSIIFDWTPPESICFVVNHNRLFTPTRACTLCSSVFDSTSGVCDMRFGNKQLANAIANSSCDDTSRWSKSNTDHDSSYKFFKVNSVSDQVSYLRQDIHKDTLAQWIDDGDTLLMSADLITDHFVGTGNFRFQYLYGPPDPVKPDTVDTIITATDPVISQGSQAWVSRYNFPVALYFHPVPPNGTEFKKGRVEVYVKSGGSNAGSITVDNVRLEPVKPEYNYSRFVAYDSIKTGWLLKAGNGRQTVFAQYEDKAGNETQVVWDTVVLDTTSPVCAITIPSDSQMVSSTLSIFGYAYDQSDTGRYFWKYNLDYRPDGNEIWYPIRPDSVSYTAVYFEPPGSWLGDWWTDSVTNHYHYDLKVLVKDSAGNQAEDTVYGVYVSNADPPGGDGDGFGGFGGEAEAMSLDKDDNLYLISTETPADQIDLRVRGYSPTGESLLAFSAKLATDSTKIPWPSAIVVDDSSRILVLDGLNNCLKIFDKTGKFLIKVGSRGTGQGQFINPSDLKWDRPHGTKTRLFIADKGNKRVQVLTKQGSFLRQFGTDSIALQNPIALVHTTFNQTCVLDVQNDTGRLFVFDSTGKLKRTVTSFNLKNPTALTLDSKNNLFIADAGNKRILELSPILTHIYSFGTEGDSFGQFRNPTALTVTKDSRYLYVYDRGKRTISKFTMIKSKKRGGGGGQSEELLEILPTQLMLYAPKPNPAKRLVTLKYAVPRPEKVSLIIYDIVGRQTKTITDKIHKPGFYTQTWDGKDARGRELSAGVYFCLLKDDEKILTKKVVLIE